MDPFQVPAPRPERPVDAPEASAEGALQQAVGSGTEPESAVPAPLPPVPTIERVLTLTPSAADLQLAGASLEFPQGAVESPVELTVRFPADLSINPLPPGTLLGSMDVQPWNPPLTSTAIVRIPLQRPVDPSLPLELLAWQPAMRAYLVVATGTWDPQTERASFGVNQLGTFIVRPVPVQSDVGRQQCADTPLRMGRAWPQQSEQDTVGLVEETDRLDRQSAFTWLTDLRLVADPATLEFKNEEVRDSGATSRDERDHQDEDFVMDPAAAAATLRLAEAVASEWMDPLSGQPAYRVRLTEAYDSLIEHSRQSTHYHGRAVDLTLSPVPPTSGEARNHFYGRLSSLSICAGFDYVLFENAYHVHASVVPTRVLAQLSNAEEWTMRLSRPGQWYLQPAGVTGRAGEHSVDGLRTLLVEESQGWLPYRSGLVPMGSNDADGVPLALQWPPALLPPSGDVQQLWFVPDSRAWSVQSGRP